jgi:hypothetical protein
MNDWIINECGKETNLPCRGPPNCSHRTQPPGRGAQPHSSNVGRGHKKPGPSCTPSISPSTEPGATLELSNLGTIVKTYLNPHIPLHHCPASSLFYSVIRKNEDQTQPSLLHSPPEAFSRDCSLEESL